MSASLVPSPKSLQTQQLLRMINNNQQPNSSSNSSSLSPSLGSGLSATPCTWKILLYDSLTLDIVSPLLSVAQLRAAGITLHLPLINTSKTQPQRDAIPDTPAVYFIQPNKENLDQIVSDMRRQLYASYHINCCSSMTRDMLEYLCQQVLAHDLQQQAHSSLTIHDQFCEFISLEDNLISFAPQQQAQKAQTQSEQPSFTLLNHPSTPDAAIESLLSHLVEQCFSLCVTVGQVPIIRCQKGGAAEMLARALDQRLRSHLSNRSHLFMQSHQQSGGSAALSLMGQQSRPLLLLFDRSVDLCAPLMHTWTYQSLLADLLHLANNRLTVTDIASESSSEAALSAAQSLLHMAKREKTHTYDLSTADDAFWRKHAGSPFPTVAAAVQDRLEAYQSDMARIAGKGIQVNSDGTMAQPPDDMNAHLSETISALPKLQRKKRILDTHTNIATQLLKCIKSRDIDKFVEFEAQFMARNSNDKESILKLIAINDENKGTMRDRLRAVAVWWLTSPSVADETISQLKETLQQLLIQSKQNGAAGTPAAAPKPSATGPQADEFGSLSDLAALDYIKSYKFLHKLSSESTSQSQSGQSLAASSSSSDTSSGKGWLNKLAAEVYSTTSGVLAGVRQLLPVNTNLPLTRQVEQLLSTKSLTLDQQEAHLYFDPLANKGRPGPIPASSPVRQQMSTLPFAETIVCVLGGGCYAEYANLQELAAKLSQQAAEATGGQLATNAQTQRIVYACTELVSPQSFLHQLSTLGEAERAKRQAVPVD